VKVFQGLSNTTKLSNCEIYVGGSSASMHDINMMLNKDFKLIFVFVVVGIFILLVIVLRGIVVSLISIVSIALAITWSLTAAMILFQQFFGERLQWILPIMLFSIMMGLGMDYNIFLITRIREERLKGRANDDAIVEGISRTGGIIMACGAIMATAFGTLMLAEFSMLKQFGFALVFAIGIDAIIVMMFLMPALMKLTGEWNWWFPFSKKNKVK
jgi:RND superfamily putative drug exporter